MNKLTFLYVSVGYTEGLDQRFARASYTGITLEARFGPNIGISERFATGDFVADYAAMIQRALKLMPEDESVPLMASSTLDSFMYEAGYDTMSEISHNIDRIGGDGDLHGMGA